MSCASCLAGYDTGVLVHPYRVEGAVPGCRSKNLASGHEDQEIVDTQAMTSSKGGACSQECSTTLQEKNEKLLQMGAIGTYLSDPLMTNPVGIFNVLIFALTLRAKNLQQSSFLSTAWKIVLTDTDITLFPA